MEQQADSVVQWKALSLTHVVYPAGDRYGQLLALISLMPFAVVVAQFTLTIFVRDIHVILFLMGQLLNESLNAVLKAVVREPRPVRSGPSAQCDSPTRSFGWPSSHCQFMAFFLTYSGLCVALRLRRLRPAWFCALLLLAATLCTALVMHSRTYLAYHHVHQCVHGALIGAAVAALWYVLVQRLWEPLLYRHVLWRRPAPVLGLCSIYLPPVVDKLD